MNNIDLSDLEIIDFHVHMPLRAGIQELMDRDIEAKGKDSGPVLEKKPVSTEEEQN